MKLTKKGKITHTVTLSGEDIIELLHQNGTDYAPGSDATVEFKVPSGGDYSGMDVDFLKEERVTVRWTKATGDEE